MTERLLQFIWQFQYFNRSELTTSEGEVLQVIHPGQYNTNQGPDFLHARVLLGEATWVGSVELHLKKSDWIKHRHEEDRNYGNVILHVVWEDDAAEKGNPQLSKQKEVAVDNGSVNERSIPVLELQSRVAKTLLHRYSELMRSISFIPCEKNIHAIPDITWTGWKERLLAERLIRKAGIAETFLQQNKFHWEETFWWLLARNFGMKVNADAFEAIARSIPLSLLAKHKNQIHQLEALLLGQAGLLSQKFEGDYPNLLTREYHFLQKKYRLTPVSLPVHALRMRPGNFPAIRLAELAMLVHESSHLFSRIIEAASATEIRKFFAITANDYWHYHYQLDKETAFRKKSVGSSMVDNLIINTVAPLLFLYGSHHKENRYRDMALNCLMETRAEQNQITRGFVRLEIKIGNAADSQALIELKNQYCQEKRCLDCSIGHSILKG